MKPLPSKCPHCGSDCLSVGSGAGPHPARIVCESCGRFIKWLSKRTVAQLGLEVQS